VSAILAFLAGGDILELADEREALEREIDAAGDDAVRALDARLKTDLGWRYHPPDPLARRIHHLLADRYLQTDSRVMGAERLAGLASRPVVLFANHLSYSDANVIQALLHRSGAVGLADRLTALAGPKVFSNRQRRFSSLCFGTVKVPQSAELSSEEAVMSARDVARAARESIDAARERLGLGDALLLFGEGTRSRTAAMQRLLAGVARYLDVPGTWVLPVGLAGSESLFPIDQTRIHPARIVMYVGHAVPAERLLARASSDRRVVMDAIGLAIAALLPAQYRGVYGRDEDFPEAAQALRASNEGSS
jgi:1-acyl-sn-glycerol-3-phosphate acyltransferase